MSRFSDGEGYGFIRRSGGGPDVHFFLSATEGRILENGDEVVFIEERENATRASRVVKLIGD